MVQRKAAAFRGGTSRMSREAQVRICEGLGVKIPGSTRPQTSYQGTEQKFGNKVVNVQTGMWFDFEAGEGGTLRDLMHHRARLRSSSKPQNCRIIEKH